MAKGGSRGRRSHARDARGRFASTGTTGRKAKPARTTFRQRQAVSLAKKRGQTGYLGSATRTAKARLKASKAKLTPGASRQQKAAVTRAQRMAAALAGQRRIKTATPAGVMKGRVKRDPGVGARLGAVKRKTIQSEQARKDRTEMAADRKRGAEQLLAMPKAARRAIQTARTARRDLPVIAGRTSALLQDIAEGRTRLASNYGKRKDKLSPKAVASITESMQSSANKLRAIVSEQKARKARPASKVVPRSERRKVTGPRKAGVIAKPKGLKPGALAGKGGKKPASKAATPKATPAKQSPSLARGERILSRLQGIGKGKTGRKLRQSQIVAQRAADFYRQIAPWSLYERGAKAGEPRPRSEVLSGLARNLRDKEKISKVKRLVSRAPASGIRQRLEQQFSRRWKRGTSGILEQRIRTARSALGPMSDAQYRQSLAYSGTRSANKIETSVAVRRRALEFLANPRSGQKLPALSRPAPRRKAAASAPKPVQYTPPKREGVKATERQRARRKIVESRYGVKQTRNSMRFGIKGKRTKAQIKRTATRRLFRRLEDVKGTRFVGSTARGSIYRFPVNQQYNIFGGVDRARATRGRKIGTRKPGSRKIDPITRR